MLINNNTKLYLIKVHVGQRDLLLMLLIIKKEVHHCRPYFNLEVGNV